jgi:hypothetical protein
MNFESLPAHMQKFITEIGMKDRVAGVALFRGDASDNEAVGRFLSPRTSEVLLSHYTSWDRLDEALRRQSLRMKRIDQFSGDIRDGTFPHANSHSKSAIDSELKAQFPMVDNMQAVLASHEVSRSRAFAHCWFEGWEECPTMWRDYGWGGTGVCILTRSSILFDAAYQTSTEFHMMLGGCFYRNDDEPIPSTFGSMPLFCKRRQFSSENEVRLVAQIIEGTFNRVAEVFEWVPLRTNDFIERLIIGPKVSADAAHNVRAEMKAMVPGAVVLNSIITASEVR